MTGAKTRPVPSRTGQSNEEWKRERHAIVVYVKMLEYSHQPQNKQRSETYRVNARCDSLDWSGNRVRYSLAPTLIGRRDVVLKPRL